jgi:hypothetical protein
MNEYGRQTERCHFGGLLFTFNLFLDLRYPFNIRQTCGMILLSILIVLLLLHLLMV